MDKQRKQELAELKPTAEMMNEDQFWAIVQKAVDEAGDDEDEYLEVVMHELSKLSLKEMVGFRLRTDKLLYDSYTSEMWCAGYLMNGGCSDDGFEYFRLWVNRADVKCTKLPLLIPTTSLTILQKMQR